MAISNHEFVGVLERRYEIEPDEVLYSCKVNGTEINYRLWEIIDKHDHDLEFMHDFREAAGKTKTKEEFLNVFRTFCVRSMESE